MPIRVLHIIGSLRLGGAQTVVKHIVENSSNEFEHVIYPLRPKGAVFDIKAEIIENSWCNYNPRKFFDIIRICKERKINVIASHLSKPIMGALLAKKYCNAKVVVHEHGPLVRAGVQYDFYRFMLKCLWKRADAFIAISNDISTALQNRAGVDISNITIVPNAVDLAEFNPTRVDIATHRKELDVSGDKIILGYVGRLADVKGVDAFIKSVAKLPDNFLAYLCGTGPEQSRLKALAEELNITDRVKFMGFHKDVAGFMSVCDVGVVPSVQEPFGIVGLEFMAMNVPVVSTGVSGMADYMVDGKNALLVDVNSPEQIADRIEKITSKPSIKQRLVEGGAKTSQNYSVQRCVEATEAIYKSVCV